MDLLSLRQKYQDCQRCPFLVKNRTQVVFGSGNPQAKVLLIGEAPGVQEDEKGIPFCGQSGKVLDQLLSSINLSREDIFITNTILCRPPNNRNPTKTEVDNCHDRLNEVMNIMKPKIIVTIGNFATERILGKKGVTSLRGKKFTKKIENVETKVIPIIHPANYLYSGRNQELMKMMLKDFQTISQIINKNEKKI